MTDEEKAKINKEINDQRNKNKKNIDRVYSIKNDKLRYICHSCMYSLETGKPFPHPMKIWKERGIEHIIEAIPESITDCWLLLVKDWNENLEEYEREICLHPHEPYWKNWGIDIIE